MRDLHLHSGIFTLRLVTGSPHTREEHIDAAWRVLSEEAEALLGSK